MNLKSTLVALTIGLLSATNATAQTELYVGYQPFGSHSDSLSVVSTTGGVLTITESKFVTTDISEDVNGILGMALHPFTNDMYVLYQIESGNSETRRLGIIDVSDASITDIGECGNITDITFVDGTLYGTSGTPDGWRFGRIDVESALFDPYFTHLTPDASNAINFDFYNQRIIKSTQFTPAWDEIDAMTLDETSITFAGSHTGWTTGLAVADDENMYSGGNSNINTVNTSTFAFTSVLSLPSTFCGMAFSEYPTSLWVNGGRRGCNVDSLELVVINGGTSYEWYKDGLIISGADDASYFASEEGEYYAAVDGVATNPVTIEFNTLVADFSASDNPAFLEGAASVDVSFFELVAGATSYEWDSGEGETSSDEDPIFTFDAIGTYEVSLTVKDSVTRCEDTKVMDLVVAGGVGLSELEIDLNVFPIPANDMVTIKYTGTESYTVQLLNVNGQILNTFTITPNNNNEINVSDLAPGNYMFNVTDGTSNSKYRFVKQ